MEHILGIISIVIFISIGIFFGYCIWGQKKEDEDSPKIEGQAINLVEDAIFIEPWKYLSSGLSVKGDYVFTHKDWWRIEQIREIGTGRTVPQEEWASIIRESFRGDDPDNA